MWHSSASEWLQYWKGYDEALLSKHEDLPDLDAFVFTELPSRLASRPAHQLAHEEYARLVTWKLKRGKWRPRLQKFADSLAEHDVASATGEAFAMLSPKLSEDLDLTEVGEAAVRALKMLLPLSGCGPATASAVLAAASPRVPFMSDELLNAAFGERKYTQSVSFCRIIHTTYSECSLFLPVYHLMQFADSFVWYLCLIWRRGMSGVSGPGAESGAKG